MKKIIIIIIFTFFLTGCYDYQELNNRAIIAGFAIDAVEDEIKVTYEIMSTKKSDSKDSEEGKSYYVEGVGKTLADAFQKANLSLNKEPTFYHIKTVILSKEVAEEKIPEIIDYLIRDPEIYNMFYPVVSMDIPAYELIQTTSKENPIASEVIENMIENNKASNTITASTSFEDFLNQMIDSRNDGYVNTIEKKDNTLALNGIAIFKNQKLVTTLNIEEAATFNALNNKSPNYYITNKCPNNDKKFINVDLYENDNTEIEFEDNKIIFNVKLEGNIIEDNCNLNFRETAIYEELGNIIAENLKEKFIHLYAIMKEKQTDLLKIQEKYYKKTRQELTNWYDLEVEFQIHLKINKNGLIFEVKKDE